MVKEKFVIIGGGVAGLCCAIRLAELGEPALLIEGGTYPAHKVCGEFLSAECIHDLMEWGIQPIEIPKVILRTSENQLSLKFPTSAGGMSHLQLDPALVKLALAKGVKIKTNTKVTSFQPKTNPYHLHTIHLDNDQIVEVKNVIIAAGRFGYSSRANLAIKYKGFKTHFELISNISNLEMFSFPGAYLGISPIGNHQVNIACLADYSLAKKMPSELFMNSLISQNPYLNSLLKSGKNLLGEWMEAYTPNFGIKVTPDWLDAYFIGDAAFTVPPACGGGLALGITGGKLAAELAVSGKAEFFKKSWNKKCASQLFWAKILHRLMLNPSYGNYAMRLSNNFPFIANKLYDLTRQ